MSQKLSKVNNFILIVLFLFSVSIQPGISEENKHNPDLDQSLVKLLEGQSSDRILKIIGVNLSDNVSPLRAVPVVFLHLPAEPEPGSAGYFLRDENRWELLPEGEGEALVETVALDITGNESQELLVARQGGMARLLEFFIHQGSDFEIIYRSPGFINGRIAVDQEKDSKRYRQIIVTYELPAELPVDDRYQATLFLSWDNEVNDIKVIDRFLPEPSATDGAGLKLGYIISLLEADEFQLASQNWQLFQSEIKSAYPELANDLKSRIRVSPEERRRTVRSVLPPSVTSPGRIQD